jgi:hypothetical protein
MRKDGTFHISAPEKSVPEESKYLPKMAYGLAPLGKLTDLLVEVDSWTNSSACFTRDDAATTSMRDKEVVFSAILADATTLGLRKKAQVCPSITFRQLVWMPDYDLREELYQKALSEVVNFHHRFSFSSYWGKGKPLRLMGSIFQVPPDAAACRNIPVSHKRSFLRLGFPDTKEQYGVRCSMMNGEANRNVSWRVVSQTNVSETGIIFRMITNRNA